MNKISIEQYLEKVAQFTDSEYGKLVRGQFKDIEGNSELGMLAAPTKEELEQLKKAVAIMTLSEKQNAGNLTDDQIQRIADDARVDPANFAIFINGYALECRRVSPSKLGGDLRKSTTAETN
ncbi:MAG: hypothetical protein WAV28_12320 [Sedimentisphaerales bacterium]